MMGFFQLADERIDRNKPPVQLLHQQGCKLCTLDVEARHLSTPKMPAFGAEKPIVYILGEAPGKNEDQLGKHFIGASGALLRDHIPKSFLDVIRWNNTVNCRPKDDRDPTSLEIECCRPRQISDIEAAQPDAIFGFGGIALNWADRSNPFAWRGRRFPIKVGEHKCWFYAFHHPAYLLHLRKENNGRDSNYELAFKIDLKRAFQEVAAGLPEPFMHTEAMARADIHCVTGHNPGDLQFVLDFLEHASREAHCGVDYETQGLRPYAKDALILSAAVATWDKTCAFAIDHPNSGWSSKERETIKQHWKKFLLSQVRKCVHSLHFEQEWSAFFFGREVLRQTRWEDSLTQAYILDERKDCLSLEFLTQLHFNLNIKKLTSGLNKNNMKGEPLNKLLPYNGIDAKYHLYTFAAQYALIEELGLSKVYEEKLRQIPTCVLTQLEGLPVDYNEVNHQRGEYQTKIQGIVSNIQALPEIAEFKQRTGRDIKLGSDDDVLIVLRDILGQKVASTDKKVLEKIKHPFAPLEIAWRNTTKMLSTYIERLSEENAYPDKKYHPNFGTCFTDTGRLNSDFQNWPKRDEKDKELRRQIAAKGEGLFASLDYGQIEARLICCSSRDPSYTKATWDGLDVHGHWARRIAKRYPDAIGGIDNLDDPKTMDKFRDKVKNKWTFPCFFTAALASVAGYMEIPVDVLAPEYAAFWDEYAGVKRWHERIINKFRDQGYTECLNGRRRRAPLGLGQVVNSSIQGSAADIVMDAMNRLSEMEIPALQPKLNIHDDLTFWFVDEKELCDHIDTIIDEMLNVRFPWICVPLTVDLSVGPNWCDMQKIAVFSSDQRLGWPIRAAEFQ
jgi:uracil-DNA glycosylase family 4